MPGTVNLLKVHDTGPGEGQWVGTYCCWLNSNTVKLHPKYLC